MFKLKISPEWLKEMAKFDDEPAFCCSPEIYAEMKKGWDDFLTKQDCGSNSCKWAKKGGMRTNGPCRCIKENPCK